MLNKFLALWSSSTPAFRFSVLCARLVYLEVTQRGLLSERGDALLAPHSEQRIFEASSRAVKVLQGRHLRSVGNDVAQKFQNTLLCKPISMLQHSVTRSTRALPFINHVCHVVNGHPRPIFHCRNVWFFVRRLSVHSIEHVLAMYQYAI